MKYKLIDGVYHFELELKGHDPIRFTGTTSDAWLEVAQNILNKK